MSSEKGKKEPPGNDGEVDLASGEIKVGRKVSTMRQKQEDASNSDGETERKYSIRGYEQKKYIDFMSGRKGDKKKDKEGETKMVDQPLIFIKQLSDAGLFAYGSLCALALRKLFRESAEWDSGFELKTLKALVAHTEQPRQVESSMFALLQGEGQEELEPFLDMLVEEDIIKRFGKEMIPQDLVALGLRDGVYDARMRVLIKFIALMLRVDWSHVEDFEECIVESLRRDEHEPSLQEMEEKKKAARKRRIQKIAIISSATIASGILLGVTGGLAAPLIAGGIGALVGGTGAVAAVIGTAAGMAVMGSLFGAAGAGLGAYKMKKRVGDIEEFEFDPLTEGYHLHVTVAITGWLTVQEPDCREPWRNLLITKEQYSLRYETKYLRELGSALNYFLGLAHGAMIQTALEYTVLSGLVAAIAWPATLLSMANIIDNPWSVCLQRSVGAGRQLAEVLLARQQGHRPVTLIGYSLGARVIFYCLTEMAQRRNCEGIIEDVILLGTPASGDAQEWQKFERVVAGRIINGYCRTDWLLKFLYRTTSTRMSIAGLAPVDWSDRRMHNIDLSELVEGHTDYRNKLDDILNVIGVRTKLNILEASDDEADDKTSTVLSTDPPPYEDALAASGRTETSSIAEETSVLLGATGTRPDEIVNASDVVDGSNKLYERVNSGMNSCESQLSVLGNGSEVCIVGNDSGGSGKSRDGTAQSRDGDEKSRDGDGKSRDSIKRGDKRLSQRRSRFVASWSSEGESAMLKLGTDVQEDDILSEEEHLVSNDNKIEINDSNKGTLNKAVISEQPLLAQEREQRINADERPDDQTSIRSGKTTKMDDSAAGRKSTTELQKKAGGDIQPVDDSLDLFEQDLKEQNHSSASNGDLSKNKMDNARSDDKIRSDICSVSKDTVPDKKTKNVSPDKPALLPKPKIQLKPVEKDSSGLLETAV